MRTRAVSTDGMMEEGLFEEMIFSRSCKMKRSWQYIVERKECSTQRLVPLESRQAQITQGY